MSPRLFLYLLRRFPAKNLPIFIVCPVEDIDAVVQLESDFVVMQPDGTFYNVPNLDRAVKARYMLDNVRVTGEIHKRYKSIVAEKLEVENDDGSGWRTTLVVGPPKTCVLGFEAARCDSPVRG